MSKSGALSSTCPKFFQNECRPIPDLPVGSCRLWYILSGTACLSWHLDWQRPDPVICKKLAAWLRCICRRWLPLGMWWSDPFTTSRDLWAYWPFLLGSGGWSHRDAEPCAPRFGTLHSNFICSLAGFWGVTWAMSLHPSSSSSSWAWNINCPETVGFYPARINFPWVSSSFFQETFNHSLRKSPMKRCA